MKNHTGGETGARPSVFSREFYSAWEPEPSDSIGTQGALLPPATEDRDTSLSSLYFDLETYMEP